MGELEGLPIEAIGLAAAGEAWPAASIDNASNEVAHSAENLRVFISFSFCSSGSTLGVEFVLVSLADVSYAQIVIVSRYS
jgi:hypothetical protein